jgi:antitoxin component YwqK of YwqJK toxin-antitoxin module
MRHIKRFLSSHKHNYKTAILIIFGFFILSGCSEVLINDLDEIENTFYKKNNQNPFNGSAVSYYPNENLESETNFIKGKKEGIYKEYFPTGQIKFEGSYGNNFKQGVWEEFYSSGELKQKITYSNNNKNGPIETYDQFGNLTIRANYKDGKMHGGYELYDKGLILQEGTMLDGKYDGLITNFYDGKKTEEITYKLGKKHGKYTKYDENFPAYILNYEQDIAHGPFLTYKTEWSGKKIFYVYERGNIKNEEFEGPLTRFDKDGVVIEFVNYKDGKKNGSRELFKRVLPAAKYKDRSYLSKYISYKDGLRHGRYYENCECRTYRNFKDSDNYWCLEIENKFEREGDFKKGLLDGEFLTRKCDVSNTPIKVESYKNGIRHGKVVTYTKNIRTDPYNDGVTCNYVNKVLENYKDGIKEGEFIQYCNNGNKFLSAVFKNGIENGPFKLYKENGELLLIVNCVNNTLEQDDEIGDIYKYLKNNAGRGTAPYAFFENRGSCKFYWEGLSHLKDYKLEI